MNGIGSGCRALGSTKSTVDDLFELDVRRLQREQLLAPGRSATITWSRRGNVTGRIRAHAHADHIILEYAWRRSGGAWRDERYRVELTSTRCHYGGARPWFLCPGCQRRVAILYGGQRFLCRHCQDLAYPVQRETQRDRTARRAGKLRKRLRWRPGILNGKEWKPKGMHGSTYEKLLAEYEVYERRFLGDVARRWNLFGE